MAESHLEIARRYLKTIEAGGTDEALAAFFDPSIEQVEYPNRFSPQGARTNLAGMMEAAARGRKVLTSQTYDIRSELASGDRVVMEVLWTGVLAVPVGSIPAGGEMRAHFAMFLDFREGRIVSQRNYDCFEPF